MLNQEIIRNGINKLSISPTVSECQCFLPRMAVPCLAGGLWRHTTFQLTCRTLTSTFKPSALYPPAHLTTQPRQQTFFSCSSGPPLLNINSKVCPRLSTPTRPSSSSQEGNRPTPTEKKDRIVTIPNLLCVSRIIAAPYIAHSIINGDYTTAAGLFVYAGATDLADGAIARR